MPLQHVIDFWFALTLPTQALAVYVAVWAFSMLRNFNYRTLGNRILRASQAQPASAPPVSIVLTFRGDESLLRRRLPLFLGQHYPDYEVLVVCEQQPTDSAKQYLTDMEHAYPCLHTCLVPTNGLDISLHNLAITLGMRAAQYEWVMLSQLDCAPQGTQWLAHMAGQLSEGKAVVAGITNYGGASLFKHRFLHLWHQMLLFTWAAGKHKLLEADGTNLLYSKTFFLQHGGLQDGAGLREGALPLAVNRHANRRNTALCLHPEAIVWQDAPAGEQSARWQRLTHHDMWRRMRGAWWLDACSNAHALLTWMYTLTFVAVLVFFLLQPHLPVQHLCVLMALWLLHALWRDVCFHRTVRALRLSSMHGLLPLMLHAQPLWAMAVRCRYRMTDKKLFRKRFV